MTARDRGSAVVEFALVVPLVVLIGSAVVQLVLLITCHSEVARVAQRAADLASRCPALGCDPGTVARRFVDAELSGRDVTVGVRGTGVSGARFIDVTVTVPTKVLLLDRPVGVGATASAVLAPG